MTRDEAEKMGKVAAMRLNEIMSKPEWGEQLTSTIFWELLPIFLAGCACGAFAVGIAVIATIIVM